MSAADPQPAYIAHAFGWQGIVRAPNAKNALAQLKGLACQASLLRSDITTCRLAREDEIAWHKAMGGGQ